MLKRQPLFVNCYRVASSCYCSFCECYENLLTIRTYVDKASASKGEQLIYSFIIKNRSSQKLKNILFTSMIPKGTFYKKNSFIINGLYDSPMINKNLLNYNIPYIFQNSRITIRFQAIIAK